MGFFDSIWGGITSATNTVKKAVGTVYQDVKDELNGAVNTVKHAVGSVYGDVKNGIGYAYNRTTGIISGAVTKAGDLLSKSESDVLGKKGIVQGAESVISTPLLLIAGGITAFLLFSGKNSSFNATVAR